MPESRLQKTREAYQPDSGWADPVPPGRYSFDYYSETYTVLIPGAPEAERPQTCADIAAAPHLVRQNIDTATKLTDTTRAVDE